MGMSQNYGVLRVVGMHCVYQTGYERRIHPSDITLIGQQEKFQAGWLSGERFVHLLSRRETTIGRALENDLILMDPTVSREHACLVLDDLGWSIYNLTEKNTVLVNGCSVPSGGYLSLQPQDIVQLGNTIMQLVAPQPRVAEDVSPPSADPLVATLPVSSDHLVQANGQRQHAAYMLQLVSQDSDQSGTANFFSCSPVLPTKSPDTELAVQMWHDMGESVVIMQPTLAQRFPVPVLRMSIVVGLIVLTMGTIGMVVLNGLGGFALFVQDKPSDLWIGLTIPLIPVISINLLVNFIDRFKREPWFLRLAAFLWGAIIAIPPAVFIEHSVDEILSNWWGADPSLVFHSFLQGLNAGVTEETIKEFGLLFLFLVLRNGFDTVTDGIVYGALIGAGFAMVENIVNFANPRDLLGLIVGRIVLGWLCHSTFTACFGAALGAIRHTRVRWQQIVISLLGYLLAVGLHTGFDFVNALVRNVSFAYPSNTTVATVLVVVVVSDYIPPFITQVVLLSVLIKALAYEAAVIREFLASEVTRGIVTVDEYAFLQHSFARTQAERQVLWQQGIKQWLQVKALYQMEIGLAFHKWHMSMSDKPKLGYMQSEETHRQRIVCLRQQIMAAHKKGLQL